VGATAEKNKMPGVRRAEQELRADEMRRLKAADKADKLNNPPETGLKPPP
jgi:hypothetical protein